MASAQDFVATRNATTILFTEIQQLWEDYTQTKTRNTALMVEKGALDKQHAEKLLVLRELNRKEDTLDKQYLDQRSNPAPTTFFRRLGLGTTQDWALALFFFAYGFLSLMTILLLIRLSSQPVRMGSMGVLLFLLLGFIISLMIRFAG